MTRAIWLCALLAACAGEVCPAPAPVAPVDPAPVVAPQPGPVKVPASVDELAKLYRSAAQSEPMKVTQPGVTPDYINRVHRTDAAAQRALRALDRQGRKIQPDALQRARQAVHALVAALDAPPDGRGTDADADEP